MKKIILLSLVSLISLLQMQAQKQYSDFDIRIGLTRSLLGSGDYRPIMIENELGLRLNKYFSTSASLAFGNDERETGRASFWQGNGLLFISPFSNNKRNDLRIGGGLSYYRIFDYYLQSIRWTRDGEELIEYAFRNESAFGFNVIIENTFSITDRLLFGVKVFTQPYLNSDINSGVMLKFGVRL